MSRKWLKEDMVSDLSVTPNKIEQLINRILLTLSGLDSGVVLVCASGLMRSILFV